jgi:hypothetical protein
MALLSLDNLKNALQQFKAKLGTPVYTDPMDVKDKHTVEYGMFNMLISQTVTESGGFINFDTAILSNNIAINGNYITLKANKVYNLSCGFMLEMFLGTSIFAFIM